MRFGIFDKFSARNSPPVFDAFCHGLERLGHTYASHDTTADVAVIWSQLWAGAMKPNREIWHQFRQNQRPVVVLEVGMLRRGYTWKLGLNGTNGSALWPCTQDPDRARKFGVSLTPWRQNGSAILIALQRSDSEQWQGMPAAGQWLADTMHALHRHTDRPILVRPHPRQRVTVPKDAALMMPNRVPGTYDDFDFAQAMSQAWCVINWNSGPGSQAVIAGVPAFVGATSLAAPVANLDWSQIEHPARPDRESWLNDLAHTEWTKAELATGQPLSLLLNRL